MIGDLRAGYHLTMARRSARARRWADAVRQYRLLLAVDPDRPAAYVQLGHMLKNVGDVSGAVAAYREAIARWPDLAKAHLALGQGLNLQGGRSAAEHAFLTAMLLRPGFEDARLELLAAGWDSDRIDQAVNGRWPSRTPGPGDDAHPDGPGEAAEPKTYHIPAFLLRAPEQGGVAWRFEPPSLARPVSQLCTAEQMRTPDYAALCVGMGIDPARQHRKCWEFVYIQAALAASGMLSPGARGLGFGTGREPLPSVFASLGVHATATDAPASVDGTDAWSSTAQWTQGRDDLFHANLVSREAFDAFVEYRPADMNAIPADLRGYDFCWSSCCLEHLGSLRRGADFIRASLDTLRPGGVAVHTTEFNLSSNELTFENPGMSLFRKRDIEEIASELTAAGHAVAPLNFWPGATQVDEHVDLPPYGAPHLKLQIMGYVCTSIGITVRKGGAA